MPGRVIAVEVAAGETRRQGPEAVTLEAMKMEHALTAPFDGIVAELDAEAGAQVSEGAAGADRAGGLTFSTSPATPGPGAKARVMTRGARQRPLHNGPRLRRGGREWMAGKFYDEWQIGDRIEHPLRRTVTETDNLLFSTMTHNPQPLHLDAEAAGASEFGQILVNGTFTFALMVGSRSATRRSARWSPISATTSW